MQAIAFLHGACHQLCFATFGRYLPVSGNIGVFAHYKDEFDHLIKIRDQLVNKSVNYKQKYYLLREPIIIPTHDHIPAATYQLLYIRRPDPYRAQVGDIDFVLPPADHAAFKQNLEIDRFSNGARLFHRPEENMIELCDPDIDACAYVLDRPLTDKFIN
jgi:hypothetical protein